MRKQILVDSIIIGGLIVAILFLFVVVIPFVVSGGVDTLIINYGLDQLALKMLGR
jgi:exopolysaccharide biosynthesis protein